MSEYNYNRITAYLQRGNRSVKQK